jgi:RNA polymerase sigma-70 factor (ECF subfamily)
MSQTDWLAERFEQSRPHLRAVAYRMLGSASEAEDAVQETWLRLQRADTSEVANLGGWLTTVAARICLDMLRARKARREESLEPGTRPPVNPPAPFADPGEEVLLAQSVGLALLVVLDALAPAERVAFVLHDLFDLTFDEIAPIVGRSEEATRQLASRARRRVRGARPPARADVAQQRAVVDAFLAAARAGEFERLVTLLHPEVVFRPDAAAAMRGGPAGEVRGAAAVARLYVGRAQGAAAGLLDGEVGIVVAPVGSLMMVIRVRLAEGRIRELDVVADRQALRGIEVTPLPES